MSRILETDVTQIGRRASRVGLLGCNWAVEVASVVVSWLAGGGGWVDE
jgi:hypothetical protein